MPSIIIIYINTWTNLYCPSFSKLKIMPNTLPGEPSNKRLTIQEAADFLQVSTKTLRRWEKQGILIAERTPGNQRRYNLYQLQNFDKQKKPTSFSIQQTPNTIPAFPSSSSTTPSSIEELRLNTQKAFRLFLGITASVMVLGLALTLTRGNTFTQSALGSFRSGLNFISSRFNPVGSGLQISPLPEEDKLLAENSQVLAAQTGPDNFIFRVNVPANFAKTVNVEDLLTAPNVIYSITAGPGITITEGQNPTISAVAAGVASLQNQTGALSLTAGSGISISGLTITATDLGSGQKIWKTIKVSGQSDLVAGSNTDELTVVAGSGMSISTDTTNKRLTFGVGTIPVTSGGTGLTSFTAGDLIYSSAANTLATLPIGGSGQVLSVSGGVPVWSTNLSTNYWQTNSGALAPLSITDDLLIGGVSTVSAKFQVISGTGDTDIAGTLAVGTGNAFQVNSSGQITAPVSSTINGININSGTISSATWQGNAIATAYGGTGVSSFATGDMLIASAPNILSALTAGSENQVLSIVGGVPAWKNNSGTNFFQLNSGVLSPLNTTNALAVGGTSTGSAKFQVISGTGNTDIAGTLAVGTGNAFQVNSSGQITAPVSSTINGININSGTFSSATWQGNAIATAYGGMGGD